jgi:hypothetical protein
MSFESGREKTGGRQAGTPNKRTLHLIEILEEYGINLPAKIFELLPTLLPEKQIDVLMQLLAYVYPKRKALEIEGSLLSESDQRDLDMAKRIRAMSREQPRAEIDQLNRTREIIQAEEDEIAKAHLPK